MKLTKVRITNFQCIQDSTEFDIDDVTCLVGKNEAGKTALLKALYRLNPINEADGTFDTTDDYPRRNLVEYKKKIRDGKQEPAEVVHATYALDSDDIKAIQEISVGNFAPLNVGTGTEYVDDEARTITLHKGYSNELICNGRSVETDETLKFLINRVPKFLYFDEYYQMNGCDNIEALMARVKNEELRESDLPLLGLIDLAGIDLEEMIHATRTEELRTLLQAAGNSLTEEVLKYWSQNRNLNVEFDIRNARSEDPAGMTEGTNLWAHVQNTLHRASTPLGTRSRGFVWFFSFLAYYQKLRQENQNLILLLDEPGLFLHARAQEDLLKYFELELKNDHQLIYTTHSPFMVDPTHFNRVRIIEDLSVQPDSHNLPDDQQGTKVLTEVLEATPDTLFPLQGALGYEIYQTLFIGPNNLVVEGVSDLLYIQTISALLQKEGKTGLSDDWTVTPVGSSSNVSTFVALIGANTNLNIATLIDYQKKDRQSIENLYKQKLLKENQVLTYADFVVKDEADVEDMFNPDFYLKLVNEEFETCLTEDKLPVGPSRILRRLENHFESEPLPNGAKFNHYRPARYFSTNVEALKTCLTEAELDRFQKAFDSLNNLLDT